MIRKDLIPSWWPLRWSQPHPSCALFKHLVWKGSQGSVGKPTKDTNNRNISIEYMILITEPFGQVPRNVIERFNSDECSALGNKTLRCNVSICRYLLWVWSGIYAFPDMLTVPTWSFLSEGLFWDLQYQGSSRILLVQSHSPNTEPGTGDTFEW